MAEGVHTIVDQNGVPLEEVLLDHAKYIIQRGIDSIEVDGNFLSVTKDFRKDKSRETIIFIEVL